MCGGGIVQLTTGQMRNFKLTQKGERNPVWKTSSVGPQGHVGVEEDLDPNGVIGCGEQMRA